MNTRRLDAIKEKIRTVPDFPKKGIMFRDITSLIADSEGLKDTVDAIAERCTTQFPNGIDVIAGIEARGFILGAALAYKLGLGFVPIRKKGKLPGETYSQEYQLEYGTDTIEVHVDSFKEGERVLLIDDLLATGGTCLGAHQLILKTKATVVEACFIVDLPDLKGGEKLTEAGIPWHALVEFEGD